MDVNNLGTKERILFCALKKFSESGYENVSMRNIADDLGIKASSLYNHYESKMDILSACYDFYIEHRHDMRLTKEQYEPILRNGTKEEVMTSINYPYRQDILVQVFQGFILVYSRVFTDKRAKEIYTDEIDSSLAYLKEFFSLGVEIGRVSNFNIHVVSLIILSSRLFVAQSLTFGEAEMDKWSTLEADFFTEHVKIVPFLY